MKKYLIGILFASFLIPGKLLAKTITVSSIAELQTAINDAKPGDHIFLKAGFIQQLLILLLIKQEQNLNQ